MIVGFVVFYLQLFCAAFRNNYHSSSADYHIQVISIHLFIKQIMNFPENRDE